MDNIQILVGCDPEIFVQKDGVYVSAHGLVQGTKAAPFKVKDGAVQVDGMALEFNIDPAHNECEFIGNVTSVLSTLRKMCPDYNLVASPVAEFSHEYIEQQPAEAKELGCDPDFNGWTQQENPRPNGNLPMRTAAGHLHIGFTNGADTQDPGHLRRCASVAKQMDFFLGLPSLFYDKEVRRRSMYGNAGAFRPKVYGVEYRTLSCAWLQSEERMSWAYRNAVKAVQALMSGEALFDKYGDIQGIINTSDLGAAEAIIRAENLEVVA